MAIERGHQGQRLPASSLKFGIRSDCDLFQGFQTIRNKGRAKHHDPVLSGTGPFGAGELPKCVGAVPRNIWHRADVLTCNLTYSLTYNKFKS